MLLIYKALPTSKSNFEVGKVADQTFSGTTKGLR